MIRQDLDGSVNILHGSVVIISADKFQKMLGIDLGDVFESTDKLDEFIKKILENDGDVVCVDISMQPEKYDIVKKYTVDNEGKNQTILEIRPAKLNMSRFLMKGEPTSFEFFSKHFTAKGIFQKAINKGTLESLKAWVDSEYKKMIES